MRSCLTIILFTLLLPVGVVASPKSVEDVSIDFIYVNANAGEAAGGHTALRLGNTIYHYQFFPDSTFLLVREHWSSFYFLYNELHNRTISIGSVPIDQDSFTEIRNHFTELLIEQQQLFSSLKKIQTQVEISKAIATGKGTVAIMGLGFFKPSTEHHTNSTAQLRHAIETTLGMNALQYKPVVNNSQTLIESLSWQEALRVLQNDHCLDPTTVIPPMVGEHRVSPTEHHKLKKFNQRQLKSILALIQSTRPDRGVALLLQTARYLAVQQSLQTKQFYTLDPFPDNARTIKLTAKEEQSVSLLQTSLQGQSKQRVDLFFQEKTHQEIAYSLLETSRARISELQQAGHRQNEVRLLPKVKLPSRSKTIALDRYSINHAHTTKPLEDLKQELQTLQAEVKVKYSYNLFYGNCATELVRSLNSSFQDGTIGKAKLGGWMEANSGLVFIPFLFYDKSLVTYPIDNEQILTSRRLRNLEALYAEENDLLVWLRESNTLSSTLYKPRSKDSHFLFFTDDSLLLRPIQGLFNIGYASLQGVAGIFTLPFDGGERLHQSGRGIFYSLPEITFCNIRKGSYATGESSKDLQ